MKDMSIDKISKISKRLVFLPLIVAFGFWFNLIVFCLYIVVCAFVLSIGNLFAWIVTGDRSLLDEPMSRPLEQFIELDKKIESWIE
jgi:hypothetical protein